MSAFSRIKPEWISLLITVMVVFISGPAAGAVALNDDQKMISPHINRMSAIQHVSLFSAAASQRMEIETPPGRGGIEPKLALVYNSHNSAGSMGIGWCIDAGAIERSTRHGTRGRRPRS